MYLYRDNYNKLTRLPLTLILLISIICIYGFCVLYSAGGMDIYPFAYKQIIKFCIFLPCSILIALIDLKLIFRFSYFIYFTILILLVAVDLFGSSAMGAKRWINLGFASLQPAELAKIAIVLMLAKFFHSLKSEDLAKAHKILPAIIAVIIPIILIIKQPDLGTGIITLIVTFVIFFTAGVSIKQFLVVGFIITICLPIIWSLMYDYQRTRILVFLDPERDPLGSGYNIIQSKIAIGSGGFFGKGLGNGTQSQLDFLPEHQTDFIFSCLAEEFGFAGGLLLVILYSLVLVLNLLITINCKTLFAKLTVIGITTIFFSHIFINISMVMGLLPAVGVPLPFMSYGGTMMASMLVGFGLIMNIAIHQHENLLS
jgi:rod shape determining protein RodA